MGEVDATESPIIRSSPHPAIPNGYEQIQSLRRMLSRLSRVRLRRVTGQVNEEGREVSTAMRERLDGVRHA